MMSYLVVIQMQASRGVTMDKDEIQEDSHQESPENGRNTLISSTAYTIGMITVFVAAIVLYLVKTFVFNIPSTDVIALVFIGMAAVHIYQYARTRRKTHLGCFIGWVVGASILFAGYFLELSGIAL